MILIGKRITGLRKMNPQELDAEGWETTANVPCLELEDGSIIYPSQDGEGNGPGTLFMAKENQTYTVTVKST